jgi:hypothetical protein
MFDWSKKDSSIIIRDSTQARARGKTAGEPGEPGNFSGIEISSIKKRETYDPDIYTNCMDIE